MCVCFANKHLGQQTHLRLPCWKPRGGKAVKISPGSYTSNETRFSETTKDYGTMEVWAVKLNASEPKVLVPQGIQTASRANELPGLSNGVIIGD